MQHILYITKVPEFTRLHLQPKDSQMEGDVKELHLRPGQPVLVRVAIQMSMDHG